MMDFGSISTSTNSIAGQASKSANKISNLSNADMAGKTDDELMEVCKEFESYFLEQIFKEMEKTVTIFKDEEDKGSTSHLVAFFKERPLQSWQASLQTRTVSVLHKCCMTR